MTAGTAAGATPSPLARTRLFSSSGPRNKHSSRSSGNNNINNNNGNGNEKNRTPFTDVLTRSKTLKAGRVGRLVMSFSNPSLAQFRANHSATAAENRDNELNSGYSIGSSDSSDSGHSNSNHPDTMTGLESTLAQMDRAGEKYCPPFGQMAIDSPSSVSVSLKSPTSVYSADSWGDPRLTCNGASTNDTSGTSGDSNSSTSETNPRAKGTSSIANIESDIHESGNYSDKEDNHDNPSNIRIITPITQIILETGVGTSPRILTIPSLAEPSFSSSPKSTRLHIGPIARMNCRDQSNWALGECSTGLNQLLVVPPKERVRTSIGSEKDAPPTLDLQPFSPYSPGIFGADISISPTKIQIGNVIVSKVSVDEMDGEAAETKSTNLEVVTSPESDNERVVRIPIELQQCIKIDPLKQDELDPELMEYHVLFQQAGFRPRDDDEEDSELESGNTDGARGTNVMSRLADTLSGDNTHGPILGSVVSGPTEEAFITIPTAGSQLPIKSLKSVKPKTSIVFPITAYLPSKKLRASTGSIASPTSAKELGPTDPLIPTTESQMIARQWRRDQSTSLLIQRPDGSTVEHIVRHKTFDSSTFFEKRQRKAGCQSQGRLASAASLNLVNTRVSSGSLLSRSNESNLPTVSAKTPTTDSTNPGLLEAVPVASPRMAVDSTTTDQGTLDGVSSMIVDESSSSSLPSSARSRSHASISEPCATLILVQPLKDVDAPITENVLRTEEAEPIEVLATKAEESLVSAKDTVTEDSINNSNSSNSSNTSNSSNSNNLTVHSPGPAIAGPRGENGIRRLTRLPAALHIRTSASTILSGEQEELRDMVVSSKVSRKGRLFAKKIKAIANFEYNTAKKLGKGNFGIVYLGTRTSETKDKDRELDVLAKETEVAIKKINRKLPAEIEKLGLVQREMKVCRLFQGKIGIVPLLDIITTAKHHYLVFRKADGDLAEMIRDRYQRLQPNKNTKGDPHLHPQQHPQQAQQQQHHQHQLLSPTCTMGSIFSIEEIRTVMRTVVLGVQSLHREGYSHKDIKPANILHHRGEGLLCDFGLCSRGDDLPHNQFFGTQEYASPEARRVMAHRSCDYIRSDIYSLGAVLYELSTGVVLSKVIAQGVNWRRFVVFGGRSFCELLQGMLNDADRRWDIERVVNSQFWMDGADATAATLATAGMMATTTVKNVSVVSPRPGGDGPGPSPATSTMTRATRESAEAAISNTVGSSPGKTLQVII
ncbi:hypothetical protein BGW38_000118 [Lunasporangiospora selenospora]|uniref:non-specific serine/threonine protein kinase n=1 Tax=Lunasporangiospora selenospora TaxID=979761 RepID=A0A9P6FVZ4_9FUNG|nr:hypothetical protein BGW38_000118 [Lunasporangiospora selenospora]